MDFHFVSLVRNDTEPMVTVGVVKSMCIDITHVVRSHRCIKQNKRKILCCDHNGYFVVDLNFQTFHALFCYRTCVESTKVMQNGLLPFVCWMILKVSLWVTLDCLVFDWRQAKSK